MNLPPAYMSAIDGLDGVRPGDPAGTRRCVDLPRFGITGCGFTWNIRSSRTPRHELHHCGACHETFSNEGAFDRHQYGGVCTLPVEYRGLERHPNGIWHREGKRPVLGRRDDAPTEG
jgi:hypothetical protein